jgi:endoglucanase
MAKKSLLNKKSLEFLEKYLNNPSPTGYEWKGQKNLDELSKTICR